MASIMIDGIIFNAVLIPDKVQNTNIPESGFINNPVELQYDVWNKDVTELNYIIKCTNSEKFLLDQKIEACSLVTLVDTKQHINANTWITDISEEWNFNNWSKPWLITISFFIISIIEYLYKFDFGGLTYIESEYIGISGATLYSGGLGYGWNIDFGIGDRDRGSPDYLRRDLCQNASDKIFTVDLPNGNYEVTVIMGDQGFFHDLMEVYADNVLKLSEITNNVGQFITSSFNIVVTNNKIEFKFHDAGGTDLNWVINALTIKFEES